MILNIADAADYKRLEEKVSRLQQVSGYTLEELTKLFVRGFELKLPHDYLERSADEIGSIDIR